MATFVDSSGDLLAADAEALVNAVNTVGVMGKGIALQFKRAFPGNFKDYKRSCDAGEVELGHMFTYDVGRLEGPRWIINFPTKGHWRSKSKLADIESGLDSLAKEIEDLGIRSVAVPPLGCGNGGLEWSVVRPLIEASLADVDVTVLLFAPAGAPPAAEMAPDGEPPEMTRGKAALVDLLSKYTDLAMETSLIEVQKLMYFLQLTGEPMRLNFTKGIYGPYADNLRHVLKRVEGHYLVGFGDGSSRVSEAGPIEVLEPARPVAREVVADSRELDERIGRVMGLADGFESTYGLELLATVHWCATQEQPSWPEGGSAEARAEVAECVKGWTNRKKRMFTERHISIALDRLEEQGWLQEKVAVGQ